MWSSEQDASTSSSAISSSVNSKRQPPVKSVLLFQIFRDKESAKSLITHQTNGSFSYVANQRMPPISALRDYLAFLATILPQLHYLAETAIGNSLAAQAAGATAAWNLLFTAVAKLVVPFFADFDHVDKFNDIDRQNLAKIDEILAIIFSAQVRSDYG